MTGPDDIVRKALASLLEAHPRASVTDPTAVRSLLERELGVDHAVDPALLDAIVLATHTPVVRNLSDDANADATEAQLDSALRKLGVGGSVAATAATLWTEALLPAYSLGRATGPATVIHTVASSPSPLPNPAAPPAPPAPPTGPPPPPDPRPARPRPAWLEAPTLPHESFDPHDSFDAPEPPAAPQRPDNFAGVIGVPIEHHDHRDRPSRGKFAVALLAAVALVLGAVAFVGWTRDPSKSRASSAETEVVRLTDDLATAKQATADANAATAAAKSTIGERDAQLAAANDQIAKMSTLSRSQLNSARFPDSFTMTGKVAAGSCSLTGEACNVTAIVRDIKVTCATAPCDCTAGSCSVSSELWRTASPIAYDASTNLFTAKGLLDGDVFRCAGVAQPTNYEFRFRVSKVTYDQAAWKVSGIEAELAESSAAVAECLSGNRTYALGGPTA